MRGNSPVPWKKGPITSDGHVILDAKGHHVGTVAWEADQKLVIDSVNGMSKTENEQIANAHMLLTYGYTIDDLKAVFELQRKLTADNDAMWAAINTFREEFRKCRCGDDCGEAFYDFDEDIKELENKE